MATGRLILHGVTDSKGMQNVYIYLNHRNAHLLPGKKETMIMTPVKMEPEWVDKELFEKGKLWAAGDVEGHKAINKRLIKLDNEVRLVVDDYKFKDKKSFTVLDMRKTLIDMFPWKEEKRDKTSWKTTFDNWIEWKRSTGVSDGTIRNYEGTRNEIEKWLKTKELDGMKLDEFTQALANEYIAYMFKNKNDPKHIMRRRGQIGEWCQWAKHQTINKDWRPTRRIREIKKMKYFLTASEIATLLSHEPSTDRLSKAKTIFFRLVSSGVRWSDRELKNAQIVKIQTDNGPVECLQKRNVKNGEIPTIPITPMLRESMATPLPHMYMQKFNTAIKDLCREAGIKDKVVKISAGEDGKIEEETLEKCDVISSKIGRKTVVSLLLQQGLTRGQVKAVIGNVEEVDAYEGVDLSVVAGKMLEFMPIANVTPSVREPQEAQIP